MKNNKKFINCLPKNKKLYALRGNTFQIYKTKKMSNENDENIDEFSQLPEYTPNKQLSQESTQQSCQSSQCSQSNEACNSDLEEPPSKRKRGKYN